MHDDDLTRAAARLAAELSLVHHAIVVTQRGALAVLTLLRQHGADLEEFASLGAPPPRVDDEGDLVCPVAKCGGLIVEHGVDSLENPLSVADDDDRVEWERINGPAAERLYVVRQDDGGNCETTCYACRDCGRIVSLPDDVDIAWL